MPTVPFFWWALLRSYHPPPPRHLAQVCRACCPRCASVALTTICSGSWSSSPGQSMSSTHKKNTFFLPNLKMKCILPFHSSGPSLWPQSNFEAFDFISMTADLWVFTDSKQWLQGSPRRKLNFTVLVLTIIKVSKESVCLPQLITNSMPQLQDLKANDWNNKI